MMERSTMKRCRCGGDPILEPVLPWRWRVRCLKCSAVEMPNDIQTMAVQLWNDGQETTPRLIDSLRPLSPRPSVPGERPAAIAKSGEGAGDLLREDAP